MLYYDLKNLVIRDMNDGSGVWYKGNPLEQYEPCCNDDDLLLFFSKILKKE